MRGHVYCALLIVSVLHVQSARGQSDRGPADQSTPAQRLERALAQPVEFDFQETPLSVAAEQIRQRYGIPVHLDRVALEAVGVPISTPVTLKLRGVSLRAALRHLIRPLDLTWITEEGALTITTVDEAEQQLVMRVHPVADLLLAPEFDSYRSELADFDSLTDLITSVVAPTSWDDVGGPLSLGAVPASGSLAFEQTPAIHDEVAKLLNTLRREKQRRFPAATPKLPVSEIQEPPATVAIRKALAARVDLDYDGMPLSEVMAQLAQLHAVPVVIDRPALDQLGISADVPIACQLKGMSLKVGLHLLLRGLDLIPIVHDEVLFITTRDEAEQLTEVRVYPISDLLVPHDAPEGALWDFESLEDAVTAIEPTTWTGGPGTIQPFANAGVVVIAHTEAIHDKVARLFAELRATRDWQFPERPAVAADEPDDGGLHLKVYLFRTGYLGGGSGMGGGFGGGGFGWSTGNVPATATGQSPANGVRTKGEAVSKDAATAAQVPPGVMPQFDPDGGYEKPPRTPIGPESLTTTQLAELIKQAIEPASWKGAGGEGTIQPLPDGLLILQSNQVHRRILKLLRAMDYHMTVVNDAD